MESLLHGPERTEIRRGRERPQTATVAVSFAVALMLLVACSSATAHPLGNNTINRQAAIHVAPTAVAVRYVMDMAEIPTLVQSQAADTDQDGTVSDVEWAAHSEKWAEEVARELLLELDGKRVDVTLHEPRWSLAPGAAGLVTLRLEAVFRAPLQGVPVRLRYRDAYKPAQVGWKEIYVAPASGVTITGGNVVQVDRSKGLTQFPDSPGTGFPSELSAEVELAVPRLAQRIGAARVAANAPRAAISSAATLSAGVQELAQPLPQVPAGNVADVLPVASDNEADVMPVAADVMPVAADVMPVASDDVSEPTSGMVSIWRGAESFFKLGVHHIATGWDHLAFLLGLLLLRQTLGQLVRVVTAFTVAHSATLALAANGWVTPPGALVEPAIALTIAYVGFVSLIWRHTRHSVALAFAFGLIHGFGFAGALAESLGEEEARNGAWLVNLASFNLGIEAFQLLLVCILVPSIALATRHAWAGVAARLGSLGVLTAGLGWFFARVVDIL